MYEFKKIGKVFTSKFFGTGRWSYKKRIYRAAVSQRLRNTALRSPDLPMDPPTLLYPVYLLLCQGIKWPGGSPCNGTLVKNSWSHTVTHTPSRRRARLGTGTSFHICH